MFVDAPHILQPVDIAPFGSTQETLDQLSSQPQPTNPAELPRGWWKANPEKTKYSGVEESVATLRELLVKDRYEVRKPVDFS